jgi:23S rRNA pseudouridine2604 synthase
MNTIRINKYIADCGVCSRREADELIAQGLVTINDKTAQAGDKVSSTDSIAVRGKCLQGPEEKVVYAYCKPVGVTCTNSDPHALRPLSGELKKILPTQTRLTYAGRLDKDSEGLLILTNDGELIKAMMSPAGGHEKEYRVKVNKEITPDFIHKMSQGIYLKELGQTTRKCKILPTGKYSFHIILTQGMNRQIRRMCHTLGYEVKSLCRIRVLNIQLGSLNPSGMRPVSGEELQELYRMVYGGSHHGI